MREGCGHVVRIKLDVERISMVDAEATGEGKSVNRTKSENDTHDADETQCCAKILVTFLHKHSTVPPDFVAIAFVESRANVALSIFVLLSTF